MWRVHGSGIQHQQESCTHARDAPSTTPSSEKTRHKQTPPHGQRPMCAAALRASRACGCPTICQVSEWSALHQLGMIPGIISYRGVTAGAQEGVQRGQLLDSPDAAGVGGAAWPVQPVPPPTANAPRPRLSTCHALQACARAHLRATAPLARSRILCFRSAVRVPDDRRPLLDAQSQMGKRA